MEQNNNKNGNNDGFSSLVDEIKSCIHVHDLFFINKFEEAEQLAEKYADESFYHADVKMHIDFVFALFTLEETRVKKALESIEHLTNMCNKHKKTFSWKDSISSVLKGSDYDSYTDEELHAEINLAEAHAAFAVLTFFHEPTLISMIKAAYKAKSSYSLFKFAVDVVNHRTKWKSETSKKEFETTARAGFGLMSLILSHLPDRVIKLLSLFGFNADRLNAKKEIRISYKAKDAYGYILTCFGLCFYNLYIEQIFGVGSDMDWARNVTNELLAKYPGGSLVNIFAGKCHLMDGDPENAIEFFEVSKNASPDFKQLQGLAEWDLCWSHALLGDWAKAAESAKILKETMKFSPSTNTYQCASFLYMLMLETGNKDLLPEIEKMMRLVPDLRVRHGGKTIPAEKFVIAKAKRFIDEGSLVLPAFELFYVWNILGCSARKNEVLLPILKILEKEEKNYDSAKMVDDLAMILLLKGVCYRNMNKTKDSLEALRQILENEKGVQTDKYIVPHAALEMGLTYMKNEDYDDAKMWLTSARDDYRVFLCEATVHLRVHAALQHIKLIQKMNKESEMRME